jgi:glutamate-5-semialdehyde dehydrogenase
VEQRLSPIRELAQRAKSAAVRLQALERAQKDAALRALAAGLRASAAELMSANELDLAAARTSGMADAMLDRLRLDAKVIEATARGVEHVITLSDPVGSRGPMQRLPSGIRVGRQRLPLGVIAIVYESRPNVTIDAAALCLKSGNAALLRGGKEAAHSNRALGEVLRRALEQHFKGVCHLFLDQGSDAGMGARLAVDGKARKPGVCNALECLLVHAADAERLLPPVLAALTAEGVEIRGCERTRAVVPGVKLAQEDDFGAEFLAKVIAVRVVSDLDGALEHVRRYGSNHTDAICTDSVQSAERWVREVDASCVLVNASTRFNDGGELGLGAEIGISTTKLHAYGPMGLESLTAEKWVVLGEGQVRG